MISRAAFRSVAHDFPINCTYCPHQMQVFCRWSTCEGTQMQPSGKSTIRHSPQQSSHLGKCKLKAPLLQSSCGMKLRLPPACVDQRQKNCISSACAKRFRIPAGSCRIPHAARRQVPTRPCILPLRGSLPPILHTSQQTDSNGKRRRQLRLAFAKKRRSGCPIPHRITSLWCFPLSRQSGRRL